MKKQWYVRTSKRDRGPYSSEKLRKLAVEGRVNPDTLISRDEKTTWIKAEQLNGLEFGSKQPTEEEQPSHIPWYEGQSTAARDKKQMYLDGEAGAVGSGPTEAEVMFARWKYAAIIAGVAGWMTYGIIRLLQFFGLFRLETAVASVAVRIGIPTAVLIVTLGFVFWKIRHIRSGSPQITADMTDEEIADELRGR